MPYPGEATNVLRRRDGPEYTFQVGEGVYVLRDEVALATPPAILSELPPSNPNPLATNTTISTAGTRLSLVTVDSRKAPSPPNAVNSSTATPPNQNPSSVRNSDQEERSSADVTNGHAPPLSTDKGSGSVPAFGQGNAALLAAASSKETPKKKKPKSSIVKSNSSFIAKVTAHDTLSKRLNERDPEARYGFANIHRSFQWLDLSPDQKAEAMIKILLAKCHVLCHDVNVQSKDSTHIDVVLGSSAGDILWFEPLSQKYTRINKNGAVNSTAVSHVQWVPGTENLFLAAHVDGTLVVYDKEKEDAAMLPDEDVNGDHGLAFDDEDQATLKVIKSVNSANQKSNPVSCWRLSAHRVNQFAFSPDSRHLAVVSEDGCLRVIDYLRERLLDVYRSYFGGFLCVCWSPDGKYVLTGGQDDLVSIWSLQDRQIVARCQGHQSWVTAVAFDPWRYDDRTYRFGSVGDDCRLLLWDFGVGVLHRPKATQVSRQRGSVSAQSTSVHQQRSGSVTTIPRSRADSDGGMHGHYENEGVRYHEVEPRARTAQLPPILSKKVDEHPLSWLGFEEDHILVSCQEGHIQTWDRPREDMNGDPTALANRTK